MRVECYWNLHKRCFSVKALEGPDKGRVIKHAPAVALIDAKFVVRQAGRDRVLREHKKNVHAFVRGYLMPDDFEATAKELPFNVARYNPYTCETWQDSQRNSIDEATIAVLVTTFDKKGQVLYV